VDEVFLSAIRTQPTDSTSRLVYADWLDERDDPRGEYLRLLCAATGWAKAAENRERIVARLQELCAEFDPEWLAVVQYGVGWRTLFEANLLPFGEREYRTEYVFGPPATPEAITAAEAALGMRLPADVREMLAEFNGVWERNRYRAGNTSEDIHLLDLQHMSVDVLDHFSNWGSDWGHLLPPPDELRKVVFVCQSNGFGNLWGVCVESVSGHPVGAVVKLDHEVGELEPGYPSLAEFVRSSSK
jgi:uncharacterized protein (TIGR02996 family)